MRSSLSPLLVAAGLTGCAPDKTATEPSSPEPPAWCEGATTHLWDPAGATEIQLFPDGLLEVEDDASPTGRRVSMDLDRAPWADDLPDLLADAVLALGEMSGFGTLGGQLLRFTAPVAGWPGSAAESVDGDGWLLVDLSTQPPERVPFEVEVLEDGLTVVLWPLRPLRMGAEHALVVTTSATAEDGGCVAPTATTRELLWGEPSSELVTEAAPRYRAALDTLGLAPADVSAMSVYTVHEEVHAVKELAERLTTEPVDWTTRPTCSVDGDLRVCTGTFPVLDFRDDGGLIDPDVQPDEADIPVTIWLPAAEGPWPIVFFGHGLGSSRGECAKLAREASELGFAVVALDAVEHGDHPAANDNDGDDALRFLGLDLSAFSLNPRLLRGNFDQTILDRRRLLTLLQAEPDFDEDGLPELDADRLGYVGISLGAILAPELLAVSPEVESAALSVGGARLIWVATKSDVFRSFEPLIAEAVGGTAAYERLISVAQHTIDPADPGTWAPRVLTDRPRPHLLAHVGLYDEVVPPQTGHALVRAFGLPHLPPVYETVDLLPVVEDTEISGNVDGATAAFTHFDQVTVRGEQVDADHGQTPDSDEGWSQIVTFLQTWIDDGTPVGVATAAE